MKMLGLGFHHYPNIYYRTKKIQALLTIAVGNAFFAVIWFDKLGCCYFILYEKQCKIFAMFIEPSPINKA